MAEKYIPMASDKEQLMICRQELPEMAFIYETLLCRHFPQDEIKPFRYIEKGYRDGNYLGFGLYEKANPTTCLAYAWMCRIPGDEWVLLDYYAVTEALRGQGIGSWFLQKVLEEHTGGLPVIFEVEDPNRLSKVPPAKRESELRGRLRRIAFYERNGVQVTDVRALVFEVPYLIMLYIPGMKKERATCDAPSKAFDWRSLEKAYKTFYYHIPDHVEISSPHDMTQNQDFSGK